MGLSFRINLCSAEAGSSVLIWLGLLVFLDLRPAFCSSGKWPNDTHEILLARHLEERAKLCGTIGRPAHNITQPMKVWFGLRLIDFDLDETTNTLKLSVWLRYRWYADCMAWNASEFNGIDRMPFPREKLWLPGISLVNTAEVVEKERPTEVVLRNTGYCFWAPHRVYTSACAVDITKYPFDTQSCDLWFQSMAKTTDEVDILPYYHEPFDLSTYLPALKTKAEWEVVANQSEHVRIPRGRGMVLMYSRRVSLRFNLTIRRRQGFFAYLLMIPCVFVSFLSTVIFCLPPERPDRNTLGMNLLACLMLLLLILINTAPPSAGSVPKLGLYYGFNMILAVAAIFLSTLVVNISKRADRRQKPHRIIIVIFIEKLGRILLMRDILPYHPPNTQPKQRSSPANKTKHQDKGSNPNDTSQSIIVDNMDKMEAASSSASVTKKLALPSVNEADIRSAWKSIAMVLDRFFFVIYLSLCVIALIILFPRP